MVGIYLITNKVNGKMYVGQAMDIEERWRKHRNSKDDCHIHLALNKYGVDNFEFSVLEECSVDDLNDREVYWVDKLDTYNNGYNMTLGGGGHNQGKNCYLKEYIRQRRKKYNEEHRDEILLKKKQYRQEHKDEIKLKRKQYRQEHKEEIRERNRKYREAHKEEMKEYQKIYRQEHKDEIKEYHKIYHQEHK